jgi:hypothetical protein
MSNESNSGGSSTADIARSVISESDSTPASEAITPVDYNERFIDARPDLALRELHQLTGGDTHRTRVHAALAMQRTDPRTLVMTRIGGAVRRKHDAGGNRTSEIARQMADLSAINGGNLDGDPELRRSKAIHDFAREVFKSGTGIEAPPDDPMRYGTQEYSDAADQLIDLMVEHARKEELY